MIQFLETPLGKIILVIVVSLIWALNVINFSNMSQQQEAASISAELELIPIVVPKNHSYTYSKSNRDPFIRGNIQVPSQPIEIQQEPLIIEQLPFIKLMGVMGSTGILQLDNGQTVMKKAGELVIGGVVLEKVFEDSVLVTFNEEIITIKLN